MSDIPTDDIASLLDDDTDDVVTYFPSDDSEEKGKAAGNAGREEYEAELQAIKAEREALQAQIAQLNQNRVQSQPSTNHQQQPATSNNFFPTVGADQRAALVQQLEQEYLKSPGEALLKVYESAQRAAEETIKRNLFPVAGQSTKFAIDQFKKNQNFLSDEEREFNDLVGQISPQDLAAANPEMLEKQLAILKAAAKGFALEKRQNTPQPRIPQYAVGSTSGGGNGKAAPVKRMLNNPLEKELYRAGIENGQTPAEIFATIDAMNAGEL